MTLETINNQIPIFDQEIGGFENIEAFRLANIEKIESECLSILESAFRDYPFTHIQTTFEENPNDPNGSLILKLHLEVQSGRDFNKPIQTYTIVTCMVDHTTIFNVYGVYGKFIRDGYSMAFTVEEILDLGCWCFELDPNGWEYNG